MSGLIATDWYEGTQKPVRIGVYERKIPSGGSAFWFWNGKFWEYGGHQYFHRANRSKFASDQQTLPWRGLAKNPKEAA